jgi:hypothetical protein
VGVKFFSVTLREEHRLKVFENRVLKRIFGHKREKGIEGWRKLWNEELHSLLNKELQYMTTQLFIFYLYYCDDQTKDGDAGGTLKCMGKMGNTFKILVRKPERKGSRGIHRHRCVDNIKIVLKGVVWENMD